MSLVKRNILVLLIFILSLLLNIYGIWWAGPDKERLNLVFDNKETVEALSDEMVNSREDLYKGVWYYGQPPQYEEREITVAMGYGKSLRVNRSIIDSARSYLLRSYAPDEQAVLKALSNMNPSKLNFNPKFFSYGGLYLYLLGIFLKVLSMFRVITLSSNVSYYFLHPEQMGAIFTLGKVFGAVFTSLSIYFVYLVGSSLYSRRTGLIAALFFSITPAVVTWSHQMKPYTFTFFWMLLSLYMCIKLFNHDDIKHYIFAGLSAGLTAGSLFTYGIVVLCIPIIQFIKNIKNGVKSALFSLFEKKMWLGFLFFVIGFILVNPYFILSILSLTELRHVNSIWPFSFSFFSILYYLRHIVLAAFGLPVWLLIISGIVFAIFRRTKEDILLLLLLFPVIIYFSCSTTHWMHYGFFIVPILILLGARLMDSWLAQKKGWKVAGIFFLVVTLIYTFSYSLSIDIVAGRKNIRTIAGEWINENIPHQASIGMTGLPAPYWAPPFNFFKYKIIITYMKEEVLKKEKPEYFILSEYQWLRGCGYDKMMLYLKDYKEIKRFEKKLKFLFLEFSRNDNSPHDWYHFNPTILIFKRKS